jgi:tetratricopeptide (TPR) repeat protein
VLDLACFAKLASCACTAAAVALKHSDLERGELLADLADLGGHAIETGQAVNDRPRDVVRKATDRMARQFERDHRAWIEHEFRADGSARRDMTAMFAALGDVLQKTLPSAEEVARLNLDPAAIADRVVDQAGADEQFRKGTFGGRVLHVLVARAYRAALDDAEFARALRLSIDRVLLERTQQVHEVALRVEAQLQAGAAHLSLDQRHRPRTPPANERELLLTELRATTLVGRDAALADLQAWLDAVPTIAARCVTGRAGSGKTRLALELCARAEQAGWAAGFARQQELENFHRNHSPSDWRWRCKTLVVVDYAAASVRVLRDWLEVLARLPPDPDRPPMRVLLLERHADAEAGWWAELTRPGGLSGRDARDILHPSAPVPLPPLGSPADRRALLTEAMKEAARIAGIVPAPVPPAADTDAWFDQRLARDDIETEPLYLIMAAIVAVRWGAPAALALSRLELAGRVANSDDMAGSERNRLVRLARAAPFDEHTLLHLAACVTLQQGCDGDALLTLVEQELAALGRGADDLVDAAARLLRDALATPDGTGADAIRPDLVGEAFLLHELCRAHRPMQRQVAIVERAFRRAGRPVIGSIIRAAQDHAEGDASHPSLAWLDHLTRSSDDPFALMEIAAELPESTVALRERAAEITGRIVELLRPMAARDPGLSATLARWISDLGVRLSDLGQREAALAAAREAVELYRAPAAQHADAFRPDLATSLNNLAAMLSDLGEREKALAAAREAVDLYRALAAQHPDAFRPDLAWSLWVLAHCLDAVGQQRDGLAANAEAITTLIESFRQVPRVQAGLMQEMVGTYRYRCAQLGAEPDEALLAPVTAVFDSLGDAADGNR